MSPRRAPLLTFALCDPFPNHCTYTVHAFELSLDLCMICLRMFAVPRGPDLTTACTRRQHGARRPRVGSYLRHTQHDTAASSAASAVDAWFLFSPAKYNKINVEWMAPVRKYSLREI